MTKNELLEQLLSNISDEFDKTVGSFFYDAEMPIAIIIEKVYEKLEQIVQDGYARTASGIWLEHKVAEQGIERKPATFAIGEVRISGEDGSAIPEDTKIASNRCVFSTTAETIVVDGVATVPIKADIAGVVGNVPSGAINRFPTTIAGLTDVINETPTDGGYDIEGDESLRKRYFEKVTQPATSGNVYHYRLWAKEISGVGDVRIIPLWNGNGTVKIILTDSDGGVAPVGLIQEVADHIEQVRPIGATVTVVSATPKIIDISVNIIGDVSNIAESVKDYLDTVSFGGGIVSYAKIGKAILSAIGVDDYTNLLVNGGDSNITLSEEEVAVLGEIITA